MIITENSFDDIFNELSTYIHQSNLKLAQKSIKIIGSLGKRFKERVRAIILLFMNLFKMNRSDLFESIFEALKDIYSTGIK